jgi:hypothetical protein
MLLVYQAFNLVKNAPFFRRKERKESHCLQGVGGSGDCGYEAICGFRTSTPLAARPRVFAGRSLEMAKPLCGLGISGRSIAG